MKYLTNFNTLLEYEDTAIIYIPNVSYIVEDDVVKYSKVVKGGNNAILYTTEDSQALASYSSTVFGADIISNTYENGLGVIKFDGKVTSIGHRAFDGCSSLTSVTIPNSVTSIGSSAFEECSSLTSVTIPNSVTSIGDGAFYDCSSLTSITIPNSVTSIGNYAFKGCSSLTSVTIPNSVKSIGESAFYYCSSLTSITIPNRVTSIGRFAFNDCTSLKTITCEATKPPTLGSYNDLSNVTAVYVPAESVDAYKTATNWSYYASKIQPIQ